MMTPHRLATFFIGALSFCIFQSKIIAAELDSCDKYLASGVQAPQAQNDQDSMLQATESRRIASYYYTRSDIAESEFVKRLDDMSNPKMDTISELKAYFGCQELFGYDTRPILTKSEWQKMREIYCEVVGEEHCLTTVNPFSKTLTGFFVPFRVSEAPGKGRGVFSTSNIKAGDIIYTSDKQSARFFGGDSFRQFLALLPSYLNCEIMEWQYLENYGADGQSQRIVVELDEGSLVNAKDESFKQNMGCDAEAAKDFPDGCKGTYWAVRDIAAGDEFIMSYGDMGHAHQHAEW
jgi:hypothetical protein